MGRKKIIITNNAPLPVTNEGEPVVLVIYRGGKEAIHYATTSKKVKEDTKYFKDTDRYNKIVEYPLKKYFEKYEVGELKLGKPKN